MPEIRINGRSIPHADVVREAGVEPDGRPMADRMREAAQRLAIRELLLDEAARQGLEPAPADLGEGRRETDEDALIRALIDREVTAPRADQAACRRYFENNRRRFPDQASFDDVHRHIAAWLEEASWRRGVAQYIALLAGAADIKGLDLRGAGSPLVQ